MNFIFIGGTPRSGTTLLQRILNGHSKISGGTEFDHLISITKSHDEIAAGIKSERLASYISIKDLEKATSKYITRLLTSNHTNKIPKYISEKTPNNIFCFQTLSRIFPKAQLIAVERDPRAIYASFRKIGQKAKLNKSTTYFNTYGLHIYLDVRRIAKFNKHIQALKAAEECQNLIFIKYENLVQHPELCISQLCNKLGIQFEPMMLNAPVATSVQKLVKSRHPSIIDFVSDQNYKKINPNSLNNYKSNGRIHNFYIETHLKKYTAATTSISSKVLYTIVNTVFALGFTIFLFKLFFTNVTAFKTLITRIIRS